MEDKSWKNYFKWAKKRKMRRSKTEKEGGENKGGNELNKKWVKKTKKK